MYIILLIIEHIPSMIMQINAHDLFTVDSSITLPLQSVMKIGSKLTL